jgi:predicted MFS family arabinose efflux permease
MASFLDYYGMYIFQRLMQFFTAGEYAVIPAVSATFPKELELSHSEMGFLGSLAYCGILVSTSISAFLFNTLPASGVMSSCLGLSMAACCIKVFTHDKRLFCGAVFLTGVANGPMLTFYNTWVDTWAPSQSRTSWLAGVGITNVVANLAFYAGTAGLVFVFHQSWRFAFAFALVAQGLLLVCMFFMPPLENVKDSGYRLRELANVPTLWLIALTSSTQYFTISGIEYFGPAFFTKELDSTPAQASLVYLAGGGGAIIGAVIGAYVADRFGGYRKRKTALLYCIVLATAANASGYWLLFPKTAFHGMVAVTYALTLHVAMAPVLIGLAVSSKEGMRNHASAALNFISTAFGYMLGPTICGLAAESHIKHGWRTAFVPLFFAPLLLIICYLIEPPQGDDEETSPSSKAS